MVDFLKWNFCIYGNKYVINVMYKTDGAGAVRAGSLYWLLKPDCSMP